MERVKEKNKVDRTLEIIALVIAILSLTLGFLVFSSQIKIESESIVHPSDLRFDIDFSSNVYGHKNPIEPMLETKGYELTAENAIINNTKDPMISNLKVNFTAPGQKAIYKFFVYNKGEYTGYLNNIIYKNIDKSNRNKICLSQNITNNNEVSEICKYIDISVRVGNIKTSRTLYNIESRPLRPRMSQVVEVVIEYNEEATQILTPFEVVFGDIILSYSMFGDYDD